MAATSLPSDRIKKVSILSFGSRGDIQPFLALCLALKERGYSVRFLSNAGSQSFFDQHDLEFVQVLNSSWWLVASQLASQISMSSMHL